MKILQVCKKFPYPMRDGESIAITNLAKSLKRQGSEVHLLAMNTSRHFYQIEKSGLPPDLDFYDAIQTVYIDNRIRLLAALRNLLSTSSYHIERFVSEDFTEALKKLLSNGDFDVIQLETPYLSPYIPTIEKFSDAVICMRSHNVEFEIWQRITKNTMSGPKKWYLNHLTQKLKQFEIKQLQHYAILAAITQRDLSKYQELGFQGEGTVIPVGFDPKEYHPDNQSFKKNLTIGFIGSLDWRPNLEGLYWFLDNVWGLVHERFPQLELHIAGRNTPPKLFKLKYPKVQIHGEVASAKYFINQHSIMLVPLLSGSGMRVKILEGMALGKVVLTTSIGLEGIQAKHQQDILLANSPQEFLDQIDYCLQINGKLEELGQNARKIVEEKYNLELQAKQLLNLYDAHIQNKAGKTP